MNVHLTTSTIASPSSAGAATSPLQDRRVLAGAVAAVNGSDVWPGRTLKVHLDLTTHQLTVQVVNSETGEVLDQIPEEEVLRMARESHANTASGPNQYA